MELFYATG